MVRSISWKILPRSIGKIDKIASARNVISETPYDFLPKVQRPYFILGISMFHVSPLLNYLFSEFCVIRNTEVGNGDQVPGKSGWFTDC